MLRAYRRKSVRANISLKKQSGCFTLRKILSTRFLVLALSKSKVLLIIQGQMMAAVFAWVLLVLRAWLEGAQPSGREEQWKKPESWCKDRESCWLLVCGVGDFFPLCFPQFHELNS